MLKKTAVQCIPPVQVLLYIILTLHITWRGRVEELYIGLADLTLNIILLMVVYSQITLHTVMFLIRLLQEVVVLFTGLNMESMVLLKIPNSIIIPFNPLLIGKWMEELFYGIKVIMHWLINVFL